MTCGIYCFKVIATQERYIGSSAQIEIREKTHLNLLRQHKHYNYKLQAAFDHNHLVFGVIEECMESELHIREQHYIDLHGAGGLNLALTVGGRFNLGRRFSIVHRQRIAVATLKRYEQDSERSKTSQALQRVWGDPHTRPVRNISSEQRKQTMLKLWQDPEFRGKVLTALHASNTEEWKQKISAANTGKHRNDTQRQVYSAAVSKRYQSAEARAVTKAALNRPEVVEKRSNAMKVRWQDPEYRERVLAARASAAKKRKEGA